MTEDEEIGSLKLETHEVVTKDGYILTLFRVAPPPVEPSDLIHKQEDDGLEKISIRPAVLVVHGLFCSATTWMMLSPNKSLPGVLYKAGYDCWLGNLRGTNESKKHKTLAKQSQEFWDFSFTEMAKFDIPAFIDYILNITDQKQLNYIGHSMGCLSLFSLLSEKPDYNSKITKFIALAPAVSGNYISNFYLKFGIFFGYNTSQLKTLYCRQVLTSGGWKRFISTFFPQWLINPVTVGTWLLRVLALQIGVFSKHEIESERMSFIASKWPSTTSIKTLFHLAQHYTTGWRMYDHGKERNLECYGQEVPPSYTFEKVKCPVAVVYSQADKLCPQEDIAQAIKKMPNVLGSYEISDPLFAHCDFMAGKTADKLVYEPIVEILQNSHFPFKS